MELKKVRCLDGEYRWSCRVDGEFIQQNVSMARKAGIAAGAVFLVIAAFAVGKPVLLPVLAIYSGTVLLAAAIFGLCLMAMKKKGYYRPYRMRKGIIFYDSGKSQTTVAFSSVIRTEEEGNKLRLYTGSRKHLIYIPEEDFPAIRDYILEQIEEEQKFHGQPAGSWNPGFPGSV